MIPLRLSRLLTRRLRGNILTCAAFVALVTGSPIARAQDKLIPVTIGSNRIAIQTNVWLAKQKGIFEKNGLDVKIVEFRSGGDAINAAQGGDVEIFMSIVGTAMVAIERGFDFRAIFQNEVGGTKGPDSGSIQVLANSDIKSISDLGGKKVAVPAIAAQNTIAAREVMKNAGVDLKTVQFVELPFPTHAAALRAKQVDAVITVDPFTTELIRSNVGRVLSWNYVESIPEQPLGVWFAKRSYVDQNPQVIERFNKSVKEATDIMNADIDEARKQVAAYTGLPSEVVMSMPLNGWNYTVRPAKWQQIIDMMYDHDILKKKHKPEEYFSKYISSYIAKE